MPSKDFLRTAIVRKKIPIRIFPPSQTLSSNASWEIQTRKNIITIAVLKKSLLLYKYASNARIKIAFFLHLLLRILQGYLRVTLAQLFFGLFDIEKRSQELTSRKTLPIFLLSQEETS